MGGQQDRQRGDLLNWYAAARLVRARAENLRRQGGAISDTEIAAVKRFIHSSAPGAFHGWLMRRLAQELDQAARDLELRGNEENTPPPRGG